MDGTRGGAYWNCCVAIPPGIVRGGKDKVCYLCRGESDKVACEQLAFPVKTPGPLPEARPRDPAPGKEPIAHE